MISNDFLTSLIMAIVYIAFFVIAILVLFTTLNYLLYTIYCINGIIEQNTYNNAPFFKLNQIYHYYLINYVYFLNKNRNKRYKISNELYDKKCKDKMDWFKKDGDKKNAMLNKYEMITSYKDIIIPDLNAEKSESKNTSNNSAEFKSIIYFNDHSYIKKQVEYFKDDRIVYIKSTFDDNLYCKYDKLDENYDLFENISRYIWELYYMFSESYDVNTGLYIHKANIFYEMLLFSLYLIFFILVIYFIIISSYGLFNKTRINKDLFSHLYTEKYHIILIISFVFIFSLLHEILYKKIFIENVYDTIYHKYSQIFKIDLQLQSAVNSVVINLETKPNGENGENLLYDKTIKNLINVAHHEYLNYSNTIIDKTQPIEDQEDQLVKFEKKMKTINRNFKISSYNSNIKMQEYVSAIKKYKNNIISEHLIFILAVYIYIVDINSNDPYILIKLNKLILGNNVVIGESNIDKNIEYTLTLRSLMYYEEKTENIKKKLINIADTLTLIIDDDKIDKVTIDKYINNFIMNVELGNDSLNFFIPVYFLNLYLILELAFVFVLILIILYIYLYYDEHIVDDTKTSINNLIENLSIIKDEIQTAVLGVI
tara:strand:+ start:2119 stop:3909 length:1791 start_codon:yes stop_codon:yes gene_type:complete